MNSRTLQRRTEDLQERLDDRSQRSSDCAPAVLGLTAKLEHYPTTANAFYLLKLQEPGGTDSEGAGPTMSDLGSTLLAWNCGTAIPPQDIPVLATLAGDTWVFRYD